MQWFFCLLLFWQGAVLENLPNHEPKVMEGRRRPKVQPGRIESSVELSMWDGFAGDIALAAVTGLSGSLVGVLVTLWATRKMRKE